MNEFYKNYLGWEDNQESETSVETLMNARDIGIGTSSTQIIEYSWGSLPVYYGIEENYESI